MHRSRVFFGFSALLLVAGCANLGLEFGGQDQAAMGQGSSQVSSSERHGINNGPLPAECTKIEGDELGREGLQLSFGGLSLTIESWLSKDGEQGEYIGFTYAASAGVWFSVKCGGDIFQEDGDGSWVNPNGTAGPEAHAISNIVFCPPAGSDGSPQPGDVPGGSGPGGGDGEPYCSEVHPELCPGGVYPGDEGSGDGANPGGVPGSGSVPGSVPGSGDDGSDDGASPGGDPGTGSVPGAGDDGSGTYYCSEEHPELCPGGVFPGGDSSGGSDDGSAGSVDPGSGGSVDGSGSSGGTGTGTGTGDSGGSTGTGDGSGSTGTGDSGGSTGSGDGSSGGSGTTTQCTEANLADCM